MWPPQPFKAFPCPLMTKNPRDANTKDTLTVNSSKNTLGVSTDSVKCRKKLQIKRDFHKKYKVYRSYNIKYINKITMNESIRSKTTCIARIFDHALPIDITFSQPIYVKTKYIHPILSSVSRFKRITSIVHDYWQDEYKYKLENRYLSNDSNLNANQKFFRADDLLRVLKNGNQDYTTYLHSYLKGYMLECSPWPFQKKGSDSSFFLDYDVNRKIPISKANLIPSFDELESQPKINQEYEKVFYHKIDYDLLNEIKNYPYFKIIEMVNNFVGQIGNTLISLSHNKQMLEIQGFHFTSLGGNLKGFEVFDCQKTKNWALFNLNQIQFKIDSNVNYFLCSNNLVTLYSINGDELSGEMVLYKNQTQIGEHIINEIYFIFKKKQKKDCGGVLANTPQPSCSS